MISIITNLCYLGGLIIFVFGLRLLTKRLFVLLNPKILMLIIYLFGILGSLLPSIRFWSQYKFIFAEDYSLVLVSFVCIVPFIVGFFKDSGDIAIFNATKSTVIEAITESLRRNGIEYIEKMSESKILLTQYEGCFIKIKYSSDSGSITFRKFNKLPVSKKDIKLEFKYAINNNTFNGFPVTSIMFIFFGIFFFGFGYAIGRIL